MEDSIIFLKISAGVDAGLSGGLACADPEARKPSTQADFFVVLIFFFFFLTTVVQNPRRGCCMVPKLCMDS
jgi:hypothetical protein